MNEDPRTIAQIETHNRRLRNRLRELSFRAQPDEPSTDRRAEAEAKRARRRERNRRRSTPETP